MQNPDIDIDTQSNFSPEFYFKNWLRGMIENQGKIKPHPCGFYPQNIPSHPTLTEQNLAAIPFEEAEVFGFIKLDFLHLSVYDVFETREDIEVLINEEPDWDLLEREDVVENLFQLSRHFDVVKKIKPRSVQELADVLALIRPAKKGLIPLYMTDRESVRATLFQKNGTEYAFKKSHATGYALVIVLQLHLFGAGIFNF